MNPLLINESDLQMKYWKSCVNIYKPISVQYYKILHSYRTTLNKCWSTRASFLGVEGVVDAVGPLDVVGWVVDEVEVAALGQS